VAVGVLLMLLVPGSAFAQPVGANQSWLYVGSAPGWRTGFGFTYHDSASDLKVLNFQVDAASPGAYVFSGITLMVDGIVMRFHSPYPCTQATAVTQPTIACTFPSWMVKNGANVQLFFDSGSTIPEGNGGYVFLQDFANKTMSNTLPGPFVGMGKPFVANDSLTGLKTQHPHFKFDGHQGLNAPPISRFDLNFLRGGLTIGTNEPRTLMERWNAHNWTCTHKTKRELHCDTSASLKTTFALNASIAYPLLRESSGLKRKIDEHPNLTYKVRFKINGQVIGTLEVPVK
jgi:hypothetical protein